jgi:protein gp37
MNKTGIQYLSHTWNPIAMRCTPVSAGCENCWHLRMANRHAVNPTLKPEMRAARAGGATVLMEHELDAPLRLRKPARIGVQFMGDLFHPDVPDEMIERVMLHRCAQHQYLYLTKRPKRMAEHFNRYSGRRAAENEWLGVSVEDQRTADERIPLLLEIPAAVRWVSYEPALGPVDFGPWVRCKCGRYATTERRTGHRECDRRATEVGHDSIKIPSWIVTGAETGPGKRPAELDWFRRVRDQCATAGVPFFFKQDSDGSQELDGSLHQEMP